MSIPEDGNIPPSPAVTEPSGGANQTRVRAYNERLVLSLVRRHGGESKAELTRRTGLSAQTVSVIVRSLENDGLLLRGEPVRGRVGQPSIPIYLNPEAAFSFGLKIGRRSADLILIDFIGGVRHHRRRTYAFPLPQDIVLFLKTALTEIESKLSADERRRISGLGIAAPFELWNWAEHVGAPHGLMNAWEDFDLQTEIASLIPYPVYLQNDATSACGAELVFGVGPSHPDFIYFFVGSFIGGGIVLNSTLFVGRTGTAGSVGSLPVRSREGKPRQLLEIASIFNLENMLRTQNIDPRPLWYTAEDWIDFGAPLATWIEDAADALAQAIVAAASIIDFSAAVIDGGFPAWVRKRLVNAVNRAIGRMDLQGVLIPELVEGAVGAQARAIGGASLPIFARYLLDQNVLFKHVDANTSA